MKSIEQIRRANLISLVKEFGGSKEFSELIDRSEAQVSQWTTGAIRKETGKASNISSGSCRRIEVIAGRSPMWMDVDYSANLNGPTLSASDKDLLTKFHRISDDSSKKLVIAYIDGILGGQSKKSPATRKRAETKSHANKFSSNILRKLA